jgi:hypothetical protein
LSRSTTRNIVRVNKNSVAVSPEILRDYRPQLQLWHLTTHNTYKRQTSMTPERFKTTISAGERPQTYVLQNEATRTANTIYY